MKSSSIEICPTQWSALPDIADVAALADTDYECLDAIRDVLIRHKAVGRFGVHLVHKHFEVAADEVLVEYTDVEARSLRCQVEKRVVDTVDPFKRIETMWSFGSEGATRVCDQQCVYNSGHANRHYRR
jgi:hypothetical protein